MNGPTPSVQQQADAALKRIQDLCAKAYRDGYTRGFEAGVASAIGMTPKESEPS